MSDENTGNKEDVLVVVSKVKAYIKEKASLSTSDKVSSILTSKVKELCDRAIQNATNDKRKTVLDRDFE